MKTSFRFIRLVLVTLLYITLCSCVQKMGTQGHLRSLEGDPALINISGKPPLGTVPQTAQLRSSLARQRPAQITLSFLKKGREQYKISCLPCHGPSGHGDGIIVQRGFLAPPSYHSDRLRRVPDEHYFQVITQGYGAMYSYSDRVSEPDRWAVIAYIRALQLSQNTKWTDLTVEDQTKFKRETKE